MLNDFFRKHFGFTRSEIRGILVLSPMLILLLFVPHVLKKYLHSQTSQTQKEDLNRLRSWYEQTQRQQQVDSISAAIDQVRIFDPNVITKSEWLQLGFKSGVADRIIKYRNAGGKFYHRKDLLKIYGISKRLVHAYEEYMVINENKVPPKINSDKAGSKEYGSHNKKKATTIEDQTIHDVREKISLNLADTAQLKKVYGIGEKLSLRIVKFRRALGGFHHESQLDEIYGLKPEVIDRLLDSFKVGGLSTHKIDINSIPLDSLVKHPYFSYRTSSAIVNYRHQHGPFEKKIDLKNIKLLDDSIYQKIIPYISVMPSDKIN